MIRKVYEIDPLLCPKCGGQMRIIYFIEEHKAERPPPSQAQPQLAMAALIENVYSISYW